MICKSRRLMIIGGGTGGHVFPGLAIAHYLINRGWTVRWIGTNNHIEATLVPKYNIEIDFIRAYGLRENFKNILTVPIFILSAWYRVRTFIQHFKPDLILGMGGYVSGPGGLAAWSLGIPIVLHEQNSIAGLTNQWLSKIARKVLQAFPDTFLNANTVGNPIRTEILALPRPEVRFKNRKGPIRILVIGGSQGAHILNQTIPKVAEKIKEKIIIWHQSGKGKSKTVKAAYSKIDQLQYKVTEFIDDIALAYAWADILICRSGAMTVSEIAAVGLPALFVPFEHKDRQQYWNALSLEKVGAAKILEQSKFTVDKVIEILMSLNRVILLKMAKCARNTAILDATEKIAKEISLIVEK